MRGRPGLVLSYEDDTALVGTATKRFWLLVLVVFALYAPFWLPKEWLIPAGTAWFAAVGAIGLNLVTGYAGQVSLGHAFFLGVGAYAGAALSGDPDSPQAIGYGLDMLIWLPAAGLIAGLIGAAIAPIAARLKGLYLAFVTLGLVFLGLHIWVNWDSLTGRTGFRESAQLDLLGFRFDQDGEVLGLIFLTKEQKIYFLGAIVLVLLAIPARNLARSRIGRAFNAIRDRDIAAQVMGIDLTRYKVIAFAVSSFYAGVAGSLLFSMSGVLEPSEFDLVLSVTYIAMILIGGISTISGSIMGAFFITLLPRSIDWLIENVPGLEEIFSTGSSGGFLTSGQIERILFGVLIVVFLILEPLGLYGLWIRARNYWKAYPFSY